MKTSLVPFFARISGSGGPPQSRHFPIVKLMSVPVQISRQTFSSLLLAAVVLLLLGAGVTLVPFTNPMVSDMGYHTLCPFAPWSTLTLLFLAGVGWVLRRYVESLPV